MKRNYLLLSLCLLASFSISVRSTAQTTYPITSSGVTATTLMNKLLGPGVIAFGATASCHDSSKGTFTLPVSSPLMFDSGIVLSSGAARNGVPGSTGWGMQSIASNFASWNNGVAGAPWLGALTGGTSYNACFFEFDFRPAGDTVRFDYVFGSEEYPGYTCSPFNDPFGFIITGPGYATPTNIALIPGTTIPVCINSLNCGATGGWPLSSCTAMGPGSPFCAYYINNSTGTLLTYSGISVKMQAVAQVAPCDTYHLKIGVADINDGVFDSGVWLKAGSLTSTALSIAPTGMLPSDTVAGSEFCVRGCLPAKFTFKRAGSLINPLTIHYVIAGTAINGTDYTTIADSVVIAALDSDEVVNIYGLVVLPATGPKTVKLLIMAPYSCGGVPVVIDSAIVTIIDSFFVKINTTDTAICIGEYVNISASGDPSLTFTWSPPGTLSSSTIINPMATPTVTTTYTLTGVYGPAPLCPSSKDVITITVYTPPTLDLGPPTQITCKGVEIQLSVNATPTGIPYTYQWTPTTYLSGTTINNPKFKPLDSVDRYQKVTVRTPVAGCETTDSFFLHVLPDDFELLSLDTSICFPPNSYQIRAIGDTEFRYHWTPTIGVDNPDTLQAIISPPNTIKYTVVATYPKCPDMTHTIFYSIQHPEVKILTGDTLVCLRTPMPLRVLVTPPDSPYKYTWVPNTELVTPAGGVIPIEPHFYSPNAGVYTVKVIVESGLGCKDSSDINIEIAPPVKLITQPSFITIKYGEEVQLNAIRISPDDLLYTWIPNDGSMTNPNINNPKAKPLDSTTYTVYGINPWGCRDTAYVIVDVDRDMTEYIPSAFTPNGDGKNDFFRIKGLKHQRIVDFKVYSRWGELVYDYQTGEDNGWDGTFKGQKMDMGVYNYHVIVAKPGQLDRVYKGNVTLIR